MSAIFVLRASAQIESLPKAGHRGTDYVREIDEKMKC